MNGMRRSDSADSRGTSSSQASGQVGWREDDRKSASLMLGRALQGVKAQPKPSEDRPPGIPESADGGPEPRQQQQQSAAAPAGSSAAAAAAPADGSAAAAPAEAAAATTGDAAQKPTPPKPTQLKADSPAFQPGALAKSKASTTPPPPPAQARVFQPQRRAAQAAPPFQPQRSAAPAAASMAPPVPGYISQDILRGGGYRQPYPGSQGMMMPSVPSVGMAMGFDPSAMGGDGHQGDWGYGMPAVAPASDQWPAHLGPNAVDGFWDQVNMQGGYRAFDGTWVPAEQAINGSMYEPYGYGMLADGPQYHGGKFQQWQAPGGRPRDTIKAHDGARGTMQRPIPPPAVLAERLGKTKGSAAADSSAARILVVNRPPSSLGDAPPAGKAAEGKEEAGKLTPRGAKLTKAPTAADNKTRSSRAASPESRSSGDAGPALQHASSDSPSAPAGAHASRQAGPQAGKQREGRTAAASPSPLKLDTRKASEAGARPQRLCRYFAKGFCKLGTSCPDKHVAEGEQGSRVLVVDRFKQKARAGPEPLNKSPVVVLKHMPVGTAKTVVRRFFSGFNIAENGIWYVYLANGEPASWGYVVFIDHSEASQAVGAKHRAQWPHAPAFCPLERVSILEFEKANKYDKEVPRKDVDELLKWSRNQVVDKLEGEKLPPEAASPSSGILRLSQLPLEATEEELRQFFGSEFPVLEGGAHWCVAAGYRATDTAFVELESDSVALEAVRVLRQRDFTTSKSGSQPCTLQKTPRFIFEHTAVSKVKPPVEDSVLSEAKQWEEPPADAGDQPKPVSGGAGAAADSADASPTAQQAGSSANASSDEQRASGADQPDAGPAEGSQASGSPKGSDGQSQQPGAADQAAERTSSGSSQAASAPATRVSAAQGSQAAGPELAAKPTDAVCIPTLFDLLSQPASRPTAAPSEADSDSLSVAGKQKRRRGKKAQGNGGEQHAAERQQSGGAAFAANKPAVPTQAELRAAAEQRAAAASATDRASRPPEAQGAREKPKPKKNPPQPQLSLVELAASQMDMSWTSHSHRRQQPAQAPVMSTRPQPQRQAAGQAAAKVGPGRRLQEQPAQGEAARRQQEQPAQGEARAEAPAAQPAADVAVRAKEQAPEVHRQLQWERSKTQWMGAPVQPQSPQQQQQQPPRPEAPPVRQQPPVAAQVAEVPGPSDAPQAGAGAGGMMLFGDFKQQEVAHFGPQARPQPEQEEPAAPAFHFGLDPALVAGIPRSLESLPAEVEQARPQASTAQVSRQPEAPGPAPAPAAPAAPAPADAPVPPHEVQQRPPQQFRPGPLPAPLQQQLPGSRSEPVAVTPAMQAGTTQQGAAAPAGGRQGQGVAARQRGDSRSGGEVPAAAAQAAAESSAPAAPLPRKPQPPKRRGPGPVQALPAAAQWEQAGAKPRPPGARHQQQMQGGTAPQQQPSAKPAAASSARNRSVEVDPELKSIQDKLQSGEVAASPLLMGKSYKQLEDMLCCPITQEVMRDPVVCHDGHSYERTAITAWLAKANTSPMTNEVLVDKSLHPNVALKAMIATLLSQH